MAQKGLGLSNLNSHDSKLSKKHVNNQRDIPTIHGLFKRGVLFLHFIEKFPKKLKSKNLKIKMLKSFHKSYLNTIFLEPKKIILKIFRKNKINY